MKSIITKISAILLVGAITLTGCTDFSADLKEVNNKVSSTNAELSTLKTTVADLQQKLTGQYATKEEVAALKSSITTIQSDLEAVEQGVADALAAIANKADKSQVDAAIAALEKQIAELKAKVEGIVVGSCNCDPAAFAALEKKVAELTEQIKSIIGCDCDLNTINDTLKKVQSDLQTVAKDLDTLEVALADYQKKVDAEIKAINDKFVALNNDLTAKFQEISAALAAAATDAELAAAVADFKAQITTINTLITQTKEALEAADGELAEAIQNNYDEYVAAIADIYDALDAYATDAELAAAIQAVKDDYAAKIDAVYTALDGYVTDQDLTDAIAGLEQTCKDFATAADAELQDKINAVIATVNTNYTTLINKIDALQEQVNNLSDRISALENELRSIVNVPSTIVNGVNSLEFNALVFVPMAQNDDQVPSIKGADENDVKIINVPSYAYYHFNPSTFNISNADYSIVGQEVDIITKAGETIASIVSVAEEAGKVKVGILRGAGDDNMFALAATLKSNGAVVYSDYVQVLDNYTTAEDVLIVDNNDIPLYTTLSESRNNYPSVEITSADDFCVADFVDVRGIDINEYSLDLQYSIVDGRANLDAAGNLTNTRDATNVIIKVELVDEDGNIVRRGYVNVRVIGTVIYMKSGVTASVEAQRVAFEVQDVIDWAVNLKDQPNTKELIKEAIEAAANRDFYTVYTKLGGVPGFEIHKKTFYGYGEASAKVMANANIKDLVPIIESVENISDIKGLVESAIALYPTSAFAEKLEAYDIYDYVPDGLKNNPFTSGLVDNLKGYTLADLIGTAGNAVITGITLVEKTADYFNIDLDVINIDPIKTVLKAVVAEIDEENAATMDAAKLAAKGVAMAKASNLAAEDLINNIDEANVELLDKLQDGPWGKLILAARSEELKAVCTFLKLDEIYSSIQQLADYAEDLAMYSYPSNPLQYTYEYDEVIEYSVVE